MLAIHCHNFTKMSPRIFVTVPQRPISILNKDCKFCWVIQFSLKMANWNCSFKKNRKQYEHPVEKEQLSEKLPNKQIANKSQPIFKSVMQEI